MIDQLNIIVSRLSAFVKNIEVYKLVVNVAGIILFLTLPLLFFPPHVEGASAYFENRAFQREIIFFSSLVIFFYAHFFLIIPRLYFKKHVFLYVVTILGCMALIFILPDFLIPCPPKYASLVSLASGETRWMLSSKFADKLQPWLFTFVAIYFISLLLAIDQRYRDTRREKLDAELKFYKAQINPHFLFNTLNAIYALTIEKSDQAPEAVSKLSSIMRYATTEVNRDKVELIKEIEYINDYVELQKMRLGETCRVDLSITGNYSNVYISPLILITFIENAFKYGVSTEHRYPIDIVIYIHEKVLHFYVKNRIIKMKQMQSGSSQGLRNAQRQLQLVYPDKHALQIITERNKFVVLLTLDLS